MVSVASTDSPASPAKSHGNTRFVVPPFVRVREETFGLLFYNTENSRLIFVHSGDVLKILSPGCGEKVISAGLHSAEQRVNKLLDDLVGRGLIVKS
jgi:putative mycofactocin binding protein MftB